MKALLQRAMFAASALALCSLTACGEFSSVSSTPSPLDTTGIAQADANEIAGILPTQSQISEEQKFNYLIASPRVEKLEPHQWFTSSQRTKLWEGNKLSTDSTIVQEANDRCSAYEQVAPGLIATRSESWTTFSVTRRNILIGQSGIDQVSGYSQVVATTSPKEAEALFSHVKNQTNSCSDGLKALYPDNTDLYALQSPSVDPQSGTATITGTYRGQSFQISVTHRDRYLIATWLKTDADPHANIKKPVDTIHTLAVKNADSIPTSTGS